MPANFPPTPFVQTLAAFAGRFENTGPHPVLVETLAEVNVASFTLNPVTDYYTLIFAQPLPLSALAGLSCIAKLQTVYVADGVWTGVEMSAGGPINGDNTDLIGTLSVQAT